MISCENANDKKSPVGSDRRREMLDHWRERAKSESCLGLKREGEREPLRILLCFVFVFLNGT